MKKFIALLLAILMVMSLVACGSKEVPAEEAPAKDQTTEEAPKEEAKEEAPAATECGCPVTVDEDYQEE